MKFVHLTTQPKVSRILKNGLRLGKGRRGRGLYAVPLVNLPRESYVWQTDEEDASITSVPYSTATAWKWLVGQKRGNRHAAAIVFTLSDTHWPIRLFLSCGPSYGPTLVPALADPELRGITVSESNARLVLERNRDDSWEDLEVTVDDAAALGLAVHHFCAAGGTLGWGNDETIEVLIPRPVAPAHIQRVVPLYRTNREFKRARS